MSDLVSLKGEFVHLLPLDLDHVDGLLQAATGDRSTFTYSPVPWDRPAMVAWVEQAMAKRVSGEQYPFATWSVDAQRIVGSTRFYELTPWDWTTLFPGSEVHQRHGRPDSASIGYTWLHPAAQRTPVNSEAKLLMLDYAFVQWDAYKVRIQTDRRNRRSRAAIERLGCNLDGVVRADMPGADGTVRDTAVYSMLASEWPIHRPRLVDRLARPNSE